MKFMILIIFMLIFNTSLVFAGNSGGNGGDVVFCKQTNTAELLDYFEAKALRGLIPDLGSDSIDYMSKAKIALSRLSQLDPKRAKDYANRLNTFLSEARFVPHISLIDIPDSNNIILPVGCTLEQIAIQHPPQFPGDPYYVISKDLWDLLSQDDKAGLILHEIIYRQAIEYGQNNSINSRYYNGVISSSFLKSSSQPDYLRILSSIGFKKLFSWKDSKNQLWEFTGITSYSWNQDNGSDLCEQLGGRLPSKKDLTSAYPILGMALVKYGLLEKETAFLRIPIVQEANVDFVADLQSSNFRTPYHNMPYAGELMCIYN